MRAFVLILTIVLGLLLAYQLHLNRRIHDLQLEHDKIQAELKSQSGFRELTQTAAPETKPRTALESEGSAANSSERERLAALETQVQNLSRTIASLRQRNLVPEYDPTLPPSPDVSPTNNPKRDWSPEQVLGPPDTERAGDAVTAWASLEANAGPEWLSVNFANAVPVAEVRIRENHNPGAISKVSAMINGQEFTLWEGTATTARGLRDFVVPVTQDVSTRSIIIHLDTSRVPDWNEIDAVELVGRDGSRQWASGARASTTWAERSQTAQREIRIQRFESVPPIDTNP